MEESHHSNRIVDSLAEMKDDPQKPSAIVAKGQSINKRETPNNEPFKLSEEDMDRILKTVSRIVARGNILLQTGRISTAKDLEQKKQEVMTYEF